MMFLGDRLDRILSGPVDKQQRCEKSIVFLIQAVCVEMLVILKEKRIE